MQGFYREAKRVFDEDEEFKKVAHAEVRGVSFDAPTRRLALVPRAAADASEGVNRSQSLAGPPWGSSQVVRLQGGDGASRFAWQQICEVCCPSPPASCCITRCPSPPVSLEGYFVFEGVWRPGGAIRRGHS